MPRALPGRDAMLAGLLARLAEPQRRWAPVIARTGHP